MAAAKQKTLISARKAKRWGLDPELMHLPDNHAHKTGVPFQTTDSRDFTEKARAYLTKRGIKSKTWKLGNLRVLDGDLLIPYFYPIATEPYGMNRDFYRVRKFCGDNKFVQPQGTPPRLYWGPLPKRKGWPTWEKVLDSPSHHIYIVEGEVKALALTQFGIPAIAIGGVDSWRSKGKPIKDWNNIPLKGRPVTLAFDADLAEKQQVQRALVQLGTFLKRKGSLVSVLPVPDLGDGVSGVDDYIAARGIAQFRKLADRNSKPFDDPDFAHWGMAARNDTDWGFGQLFLELHIDKVRYIKAQKRWMIWRGG